MTPEINSESPTRDPTFSNNPEDQFVNIPLTPKEAIDVYYALDSLVTQIEEGQFDTDLPVYEMRNIALGGMHFPKEFNLLIHSQEHARTVLLALSKYNPPEADFTVRLHNDIISVLRESPMNFDIDALQKVSINH